MANLQRLLTRRPHIDEAELEDVRERTMARLAGLNGTGEAAEPVAAVVSAEAVTAASAGAQVSATEPIVAEAVAPVATAPKPAGPKVTSPRTIVLGPPKTPPIIVLGDPVELIVATDVVIELGGPAADTREVALAETESAVAEVEPEPVVAAIEPEPVVAEVEPEPVAIEPEPVAIEPEPVVAEVEPEPVVAIATAVHAPKSPAKAKPKAPKARAKKTVTATPKPKATAPRAKRPAQAIAVVAEPVPVIDTSDVWPGKWMRDVPPLEPAGIDLPGELVPVVAAVAGTDVADVAVEAPAVQRRDTSLPVPRYAVAADDWDGHEPPATASVAEAPDVATIEPAAAIEPRPTTRSRRVTTAVPPARRPRPTTPPKRPATKRPAARTISTRAASAPVAAAPAATFCPYCAFALDPAPTSSRRCTRCRQRIVVKRVQGRVVYLTEAAVEVFDSERLRSANFGRWSKERAGWLKLAASVEADAARIGRLEKAPLSEKVVASSRSLYVSTAERQFREAKREDRWEDASHLKRDQATAMYRLAGSPVPPADEVIAMHREATAGELRGIGKMAKDAGLIGSDCCDACRADDGKTFRIAAELRLARLPHDGCPKGLCHCRWDLTLRDRTMVQRYLKRTIRGAKRPTA